MKICKGWLQALLSPAPRGFAARSRVLARLASLAQIGELARRLIIYPMKGHTLNECLNYSNKAFSLSNFDSVIGFSQILKFSQRFLSRTSKKHKVSLN